MSIADACACAPRDGENPSVRTIDILCGGNDDGSDPWLQVTFDYSSQSNDYDYDDLTLDNVDEWRRFGKAIQETDL